MKSKSSDNVSCLNSKNASRFFKIQKSQKVRLNYIFTFKNSEGDTQFSWDSKGKKMQGNFLEIPKLRLWESISLKFKCSEDVNGISWKSKAQKTFDSVSLNLKSSENVSQLSLLANTRSSEGETRFSYD